MMAGRRKRKDLDWEKEVNACVRLALVGRREVVARLPVYYGGYIGWLKLGGMLRVNV